ncbi:unnamed protein product [Adineta ricciae]|uniref:SET domain-containing protein n=2 Tax=Adineta ricciae TaxID=249248 RepID=A0A815H0M6_ADIRI|nr:unnamed protein product [Adineta ricciae]
MTYDTGIFVFNRITDENKWKLFLQAVYAYFLEHQTDSMRMVVNRNDTTGEFLPIVTKYHPLVTDMKLIHLTDQFNFIKGDTDDSFSATWRTNLAKKLYGKACYALTEEEKSIVYDKSLKKVRGLAEQMNYSLSEDELQRLIGMSDVSHSEAASIEPPIAIAIEDITLPLYAHHFKKAWAQVWHPMCSEFVIKIFRKLLKRYFPEELHYCYFNELNYLNDPDEPETGYYSSDSKYRQHTTNESREENNIFYRQIQGITIENTEPTTVMVAEADILKPSTQTQTDETPAWQKYLEVVSIENKGRGYRARCNIPAMTCIMHDTPLVTSSSPFTGFRAHNEGYSLHAAEPLVLQVLENKEYFDLLSPQQPSGRFARETSPYPSLYSHEMWQLAHEKVATNVFRGEAVDSTMLNRKYLLKLGVRTSLFNHSCCPSATISKISGTTKQKVETVRDVTEGDEICISYLSDGYLPRDERQRILSARGFTCRCERCSPESTFDRDVPLTADISLLPLSNEKIAPLRRRYDQLVADLQSMLGFSTPQSCSLWIMRAERWLVDASKPPYQLHQFHWLSVHLYKMLRDRYKTMYVSNAGNRKDMRKKTLYYGKLIIRAEFAVLQPLDPHKQAVDAFLDDWNDMGMPKNGAWKLLKELEPSAEIIIKSLNE